jgi:hypothetical protein
MRRGVLIQHRNHVSVWYCTVLSASDPKSSPLLPTSRVLIAELLAYFEAHTYLGADSRDAIALANKIAGRQPTTFAAWARANIAIPAAA